MREVQVTGDMNVNVLCIACDNGMIQEYDETKSYKDEG